MKTILYDYCRWNQPENIKKFLDNSQDVIDITFEEGILFHIAIAQGMHEVLHILLKYYEKAYLQGDPETLEYKVFKYQLVCILQEAVDSCEVSEEIQKILNPYIGDENNNEVDEELEDMLDFFDNLDENQSTKGEPYPTELTADNLKIVAEQDNALYSPMFGSLLHLD